MKTLILKTSSKLLRPFGLVVRPKSGPSYIKILKQLGILVVLDVGANRGQFAMSLRRHGYAHKIVSFEPTENAFEQLFDNSSQDSQWFVHARAAIGAEPGTAEINVAGNDALSSSFLEMGETMAETAPNAAFKDTEVVDITTIDAVFDEYVGHAEPTLLKLDVQGFEKSVLAGAAKSLESIAAVKLELATTSMYVGVELYDWYFDELARLGFELWDLEPGHRHPTSGRLLEFDATFVRKGLAVEKRGE